MERKIGEIFEYDGEWYQCIRSSDCPKCDLKIIKDCRLKFPCESLQREDCEEVIFKKLEKVGKPLEFARGLYFQKYRLVNHTVFYEGDTRLFFNAPTFTFVYIEIKQNKEDMEMRKVFMNGDDRDYLLDRLENILHDNHCLEYKDEICDSFCKYITSDNRELKPFNLEAAKAGKPVCTRDGRKARIICFNARCGKSPIVALIENGKNEEVHKFHKDGKLFGLDEDEESFKDLMMLPEKKEGWINICRNLNTNKTELDTKDIYNTKEEALQNLSSMTYVTTVKIEWEE